jgi:hypothetical protein
VLEKVDLTPQEERIFIEIDTSDWRSWESSVETVRAAIAQQTRLAYRYPHERTLIQVRCQAHLIALAAIGLTLIAAAAPIHQAV